MQNRIRCVWKRWWEINDWNWCKDTVWFIKVEREREAEVTCNVIRKNLHFVINTSQLQKTSEWRIERKIHVVSIAPKITQTQLNDGKPWCYMCLVITQVQLICNDNNPSLAVTRECRAKNRSENNAKFTHFNLFAHTNNAVRMLVSMQLRTANGKREKHNTRTQIEMNTLSV